MDDKIVNNGQVCGVDWSNGTDFTCISFCEKDGGKFSITKVVYFTPQETVLLRAALYTKEEPQNSGASSGGHSNAQQLNEAIALLKKWHEWYSSAASVPAGDNFELNYATCEFMDRCGQQLH